LPALTKEEESKLQIDQIEDQHQEYDKKTSEEKSQILVQNIPLYGESKEEAQILAN